jgi:MoaA/NifB/PqqE/SkfB family radical SAM enzyme
MYNTAQIAAEPALLEGLARSLAGLERPSIRDAKIKLTSRCNLRCRMCSYWRTTWEKTLSTERWKGVLEELGALGCRKVHFSGGEVFLRRDFLDLVEHASALGMKVNMTTNGTLLNRERIRRLVRARPNSISLSLDGPRARVHDAIRGVPGSFRRTCRSIRQIHRQGDEFGRRPAVRLNFVLQKKNYRHSVEMVELARALEVVELHPMPVDEKGPRRNRLTLEEILHYNAEIAPAVREARRRCGFSTDPAFVYPYGLSQRDLKFSKKAHYARGFYQERPCLAPWMHLFIAWDGNCYLCCMTNGRMEPLGNVARSSVGEVFWGERMQRVRRQFLDGFRHEICHRCDMFLTENARLHRALGRLQRGISGEPGACRLTGV